MKQLLFPLLILYGCGVDEIRNDFTTVVYEEPGDPRSVVDVHSDFKEYISSFESRGKVSLGGVSVGFVSEFDAADTRGLCRVWKWEHSGHRSVYFKEVTILQSWWYDSSDAARQQMIDHELGHCVLGRGHVTTKDDNGFPTSVMYPFVFSEFQLVNYTAHQTEYTTELFR